MCDTVLLNVVPAQQSVNFVSLPMYFDTDTQRKHIPDETWVLWQFTI
jgi:hypothetical protein